ncbi:unnamed protein product [Prorocentrum cordatum]|uniref:Reverse transcriptase domain-containing protein n=1 Tax=Prorocentrum cordatum TaxID=2364126 RepID=A0ABN9RIY2_9DINO|nr:unnamed protein product [Polarella glacialis]
MLISWVLYVLRRMGTPEALVAFCGSLFSKTSVTLFERTFIKLAVARGVRQGDLSSMSWFILAAEPTLARLEWKLPCHVALSLAYADGFGLLCLFDGTGPLFTCVMCLKDSIGLALTFPNCQALVVYAKLLLQPL